MTLAALGQLKVGSLNPIATDLLKQVGGEHIEVVTILKEDQDVHTFRPDSRDLRKMQKCVLIFAMGKGLESYLDGFEDSLEKGQAVIEIGKSIPSQRVDADPIYVCCPSHAQGAEDPHWWHNVKNMERAVKIVSRELGKLDPDNAKAYRSRAKLAGARYRELHRWVKSRVSEIPKGQRVLVTPHAAFGYFCKAYGFQAAFVQGLSKDGEISAQQLAHTIRELKEKQIKAIFPERLANPKALKQLSQETGCQLGAPLYADSIHHDYERTIRHNVNEIVKALTR